MKYGLSEKQLKEIKDILSSYDAVEKAVLFGSRAIDTYKEASDIDIAIKGEKADWSLAATLKDHFEEETYLPFFFDVVAYGSIQSEELRAHIDGKGVVLFERGMSEWRLSDIAEVVDCEHKTAPKVETSDFYSIRTTDISNGKIAFESANRVMEETYSEWTKRAIPETGDIILAREAPVGEVGWVKEGYKVCLGQRTVLLKIKSSDVSSRFLLYYLVNPETKYQLQVRSVGSVVSHLNMKDIRGFEINVPPLPEQKAIAEVLSSLDDKIDLLHRQNKTLEQMAETLFRQWFVEEAGEDWEETTIYDAIDLIGGGTPKTSTPEYWGGKIHWLSGGDITTNHKGMVISSEKTITESGLANSSAKISPKFSMVISARGTVGKYCMLSEPMTFSQSNYGIKPKFQDAYFFTYLLVAYSVDELQSAAYGSVFDTITTNTFKGILISLPNENIIMDFDNRVEPYFEKLLKNQKQIRTLESLRDTLLPKLMSGEIRVKYDMEAE